ncbi:hypothetical protein IWQ60_004807 [Tieghemiomyces parasiticus]|uniref:Uncharacterized protein n=1 Tax=Tieghemiomyces parasiticus TaxID=78921 RepID=A0A9W8ADK7_9FUNG|nr:hypothetical protein IWQ60_004807 [Tieghemiomyces parasiticus]
MSRQKVINDLLQLYSLDPKLSSFEIFDENGVFQDNITICTGIKAIRAGFFAPSYVFSDCRIETPTLVYHQPDRMQIHVYIDYTLRLFKVHLTTLSTITFEFKPSDVHDGTYTDKATYVEERWWGTPLKFAKDGVIGWVCEVSAI